MSIPTDKLINGKSIFQFDNAFLSHVQASNHTRPTASEPTQTVGKESMNASRQKILTCFMKKSQLSIFKEIKVRLELFDFLEQIIIDILLIKITQCETNWINR